MRDCAAALSDEYPSLAVHGIVGDFERHLGQIPPPEPGRPRVVAFLGGTIGNFPPGARRACHVRLGALDLEVEFVRGEELRTEISAKFTRDRVRADFAACGLELAEWFTDDEALFALSLAAKA